MADKKWYEIVEGDNEKQIMFKNGFKSWTNFAILTTIFAVAFIIMGGIANYLNDIFGLFIALVFGLAFLIISYICISQANTIGCLYSIHLHKPKTNRRKR